MLETRLASEELNKPVAHTQDHDTSDGQYTLGLAYRARGHNEVDDECHTAGTETKGHNTGHVAEANGGYTALPYSMGLSVFFAGEHKEDDYGYLWSKDPATQRTDANPRNSRLEGDLGPEDLTIDASGPFIARGILPHRQLDTLRNDVKAMQQLREVGTEYGSLGVYLGPEAGICYPDTNTELDSMDPTYGFAIARFDEVSLAAAAVKDSFDPAMRQEGEVVSAGLYVTEPGQRALPPHVDQYRVFALQVDGMKDFFLSLEPNRPDVMTRVRMKPGDGLYIPQGIPHFADTPGPERSTHMTLDYRTPAEAEQLAIA